MRSIPALLLTLALLVPATNGMTQQPEPQQAEKTPGPAAVAHAMMAKLDAMASDHIWPGFDPTQIPVAIFDGETTFLFRHPSPPASFDRPATDGAPWTRAGRHPAIVANSSTEIGGVATATVMLETTNVAGIEQLAALTLHEMFHVFQDEHHPDWTTNETELFTYPMADPDNAVGLATEERALARAVGSQDRAEAASWVALFLEVRSGRYERIAEGARRYERGVELREGTARYVQFQVLGSAADTSALTSGFAARDLRQRCYHTGLAMAVLLDRFIPIWKGRLASGRAAPLDAMLAASPEVARAKPARLPAAEREQLVASSRDSVAQLRRQLRETRQRFKELPGTRIVVMAEANDLLSPRGFDPLNAIHLVGPEILHTRFLKAGYASGEVELLNTPAITIGTSEHPLYFGISQVEIAGLKVEPEVVAEDGVVTITGEGIRLRFAKASLQRHEDGRLIVALGTSAE